MFLIDKEYTEISIWGLSSIGRASALQAGCQEFDSPSLQEVVSNNYLELVH